MNSTLKRGQKNATVHGIIFDLDGTLIRSVVDFPKMKRRMIDYISELKIGNANYTIEQTTNEIITDLNNKMVSRGLSANDREEILNNISDILTKVEFENIGQVQLFNGVMRFLDLCKLSNIKLSILTRASKKYTKKCLEITGTAYYFNLVFTRDDFTLLRAKPHIDSINRVINELGIENKFILFVGDHPLDQICAQNGNIRFIGIIPDGNDKYGLKDIDCWKIVNNYQELYDIVKNLNNKDVEVDN